MNNKNPYHINQWKFRFWNKIYSRMSETFNLQELDELQITWTNVIPMQFTGCLDKHGKEIYQFDYVMTEDGMLGRIEFEQGLFGINWDYGTDEKRLLGAWGNITNLRGLHFDSTKYLQVMGNKFQNPQFEKSRLEAA